MDMESEPQSEAWFGQNLRSAREDRGWSQSELARQMADAGWPKYNQMTVSRTEEGRRMPRLDEAIALADRVDRSLDRLLWPSHDSIRVDALAMWVKGRDDTLRRLAAGAARYEGDRESLDRAATEAQELLDQGAVNAGAAEQMRFWIELAAEYSGMGWAEATQARLNAEYAEDDDDVAVVSLGTDPVTGQSLDEVLGIAKQESDDA